MAINCFATPLAGLPTLRARLSSSSVDSGISEKSICESGIGLTLPPARRPRTDDPEFFFFMFRPPYRIHDEQQPLTRRSTESFEPLFLVRMCDVLPVETVGVAEDCGRFLKRDAMLLEVGNGLGDVPHKHICVYTLMCPSVARNEGPDGLFGLSGLSD